MAAKEVAIKKYVVRLSADERAQLNDLIRKGKRSAQLLTKARILLKADVSEAGEGSSDSRIAEALDTSIANILRTCRQLVEEGFESVLTPSLHGPVCRVRDVYAVLRKREQRLGSPVRTAGNGLGREFLQPGDTHCRMTGDERSAASAPRVSPTGC